MEALSIHTNAPTVHWEDNQSCISIVKVKIVIPRVKHIAIPVCFIQKKNDNSIFVPNMISLVSYRQICAPKHVQVQLSVGVLNG